MNPYFDRKGKVTVCHGLLYWGRHVVVPEKAKTAMLQLVQGADEGISSMQVLARSLLWHPHINRDRIL